MKDRHDMRCANRHGEDDKSASIQRLRRVLLDALPFVEAVAMRYNHEDDQALVVRIKAELTRSKPN